MAAKFELLQNDKGKYHFNLKARNGEIILTSETYESRASALGGIESVRTNGPDATRFDRRTAKNGEVYFVLKAANGQIIGRSEMYKSNAGVETGIASVQ